MTLQYLEILFTDAVRPDDLEILEQAQPNQPGLAKLNRAIVGQARSDAPNSVPLKSQSGDTIGFIATMELMAEPYSSTYRLQSNLGRQ